MCLVNYVLKKGFKDIRINNKALHILDIQNNLYVQY